MKKDYTVEQIANRLKVNCLNETPNFDYSRLALNYKQSSTLVYFYKIRRFDRDQKQKVLDFKKNAIESYNCKYAKQRLNFNQ